MSKLPTLNQVLGPTGQFPKTVPGYSTVPPNNAPQQPQQGNWNQPQQGNWNQPPQGNYNQPPQGNYNQPPQGNWNQPPQGNWNQPPQGNWNQPPQGNWNQPPQGNWNQPPQGNWNQPPQGNWNQNQGYYNNFKNEIYNLRNQYGMQIPDNQIDDTIEAAKSFKRMYAFPEPEKNYIRYDEKGKSYITIANTYGWAHKDNKSYFDTQKPANSYEGTSSHLIKVCYLNLAVDFKHVKPGNYKLFINQSFENVQLRDQMKLRVLIGDKEIFNTPNFPTAEMVKSRNLTESLICDIKRQDFDMNKLDRNGDAIVKVCISGKDDKTWKKGWVFDGLRLLEEN